MTDEGNTKTCTQQGCNEGVAVRVFWPGKSPPPEYCIVHAQGAVNIARAIGLVVHMEPIADAET